MDATRKSSNATSFLVRLTAEEKKAWEGLKEREGYPSLNAMILDKIGAAARGRAPRIDGDADLRIAIRELLMAGLRIDRLAGRLRVSVLTGEAPDLGGLAGMVSDARDAIRKMMGSLPSPPPRGRR